jgi:hypothetical protein
MSVELALIVSGLSLRDEHIEEAIESRKATKALLNRLADVSAPDTGIAKVLLVYARMATTACDWIDGDLCVELVEESVESQDGGHVDRVTAIHTFTELGGGLRERLFPSMTFRAPLGEFSRSIARVPHMIAPLAVQSKAGRRIRLSATELVRRTTVPPPLIGIASDSLFVPAVRAPHFADESDEMPTLELPLPIVGRPPLAEAEPEPATTPVLSSPPSVPSVPLAPSPAPSKGAPATPSDPPMHEVDSGWDE